MAFQFQCPNGHLLEAEESQAGDHCNCPHCAVLFIIPDPPQQPDGPPEIYPAVPDAPVINKNVAIDPTGEQEEKLLHIPCPNGHVLDTPLDMLGQEVMCPHCEAQFLLREKDSVEYKRRRRLEEERKEQRAGKLWLNWAIVFVVIVVLGLAILIILSPSS